MEIDNDINLPPDADDLSRHAPLLFALKNKETARPDDDPFGQGFVVPALYFEELSELVVSKTSIPQDGGLVVPENYFEELPSVIEAKTMLPETDGLVVPENYFEELPSVIEAKTILPETDGLVVPENYFEEFASHLESQVALESVLPPFDSAQDDKTIPAGYFGQMENELHAHIALDNLKQDEGFVVPQGYFTDFTERILAETALSSESVNDDQVPQGYFDELPARVLARVTAEIDQDKKPGRIVVLAAWTKKNWRQLSVAASVALVIGMSWFFYSARDNGTGELMVASYAPVTPEHVQPIVPPVINITPAPKDNPGTVAVVNPKKPETIKPKQVKEVIMNDDEIIAQSDLMDETMVMDFVAESNVVEPADEVLDPAMMEYLMNDNAGLDVFNPGEKLK